MTELTPPASSRLVEEMNFVRKGLKTGQSVGDVRKSVEVMLVGLQLKLAKSGLCTCQLLLHSAYISLPALFRSRFLCNPPCNAGSFAFCPQLASQQTLRHGRFMRRSHHPVAGLFGRAEHAWAPATWAPGGDWELQLSGAADGVGAGHGRPR